jgi:hypothetical protein
VIVISQFIHYIVVSAVAVEPRPAGGLRVAVVLVLPLEQAQTAAEVEKTLPAGCGGRRMSPPPTEALPPLPTPRSSRS